MLQLCFAAIWSVTHGFILGNDRCPVSSPCRCYGSVVNCVYQRLTTFPTFNFTQTHYRELTIDLHSNHLESIPNNALGNIMATNPDNLNLKLNKNRISSVSPNAFANLGHISVLIDLSHNRLTALPRALSKVKMLKTLRLLGNAFAFLDDTIMTSIGKTLETFWLDMSLVAIWPRSFSTFGALNDLVMENIPFQSIPSSSFMGLTNLTRLDISNSKLRSVPDAICHLSQLIHFEFHDNTYLLNSRTHVLTVCQTPLLNTSLAYFHNNNMFFFPENVFLVFPKLISLGLHGNYLDKINPLAVPTNCTLYYLYLSSNRFTSIPRAVAKMPALITLVVSDNQITSVDGSVLSSLQNLRQLTISNNPLIYIDPHAFSTSYAMNSLYIEHTNMTSVPAAILHAADRFSIQLTGSPIQCTCTNMAFLHPMSRSDVESGKKFIRGDCLNEHTTIKAFILNILPKCL